MTLPILGNILTDATTTLSGGWATTTYSYSSTSYANPDAATQVGSSTLTYDKNGNQLTGSGMTETWDWRNRLNTTLVATTSTYSYDENGKRTRIDSAGVTTHYPSDLYQYDNAQSRPTKHVFVNGHTIADITGQTGSSTINNDYIDHLGSTAVSADQSNRVQEVTDYAPYGSLNNHDQLGGFSEGRKYIGQYYDEGTQLSYLNARYYQSSRGQFISQDPVFLGDPKKQNLQNPQSLNSYSYANDNPINSSDPSGMITQAQYVQTLQLQISVLQNILALNQSGDTAGASAAYNRYQGITGSSAFQNMMGSVDTRGDRAQAYAQGTGLTNQAFNQLTKNNTAAYVFGGIGLTALGGAGILYAGSAYGIASFETISSFCFWSCDKVRPDTVGKFFEGVTDGIEGGFKNDQFHNFPRSVTSFGNSSTVQATVQASENSTGEIYQVLRIPGSYKSPGLDGKWFSGQFEIGKVGNQINHWVFIRE